MGDLVESGASSESSHGPGIAPMPPDIPNSVDTSGTKAWEKPWTVEEMRQNADNWSLAGDAGMLQYLQEFSQKMVGRTHEIQEQLNSLIHESKLTGVRVSNSFNDFIMLANTQFVENRVYDEEVSQDDSEKQIVKEQKEKTKEERELELVPKISKAIKLGLDVIDNAFEQLDINAENSDSDDEDNSGAFQSEPILEAKDPYISRQLPCIIGSQIFFDDDNVGLVDPPSDVEAEDEVSASESESEPRSSEEDSDISEDEIKPEIQKSIKESAFSESESESDGDLFNNNVSDKEVSSSLSSDSESSEKNTSKQPAAGPAGFADELASKLGSNTKTMSSSTAGDSKSTKANKKSMNKKPEVKKIPEAEDLFGFNGEEEEEEDDSPFKPQKGGLFSGGGLFDAEDKQEGSLFGDIEKIQQDTSESEVTKDKVTKETEKEPDEPKKASKNEEKKKKPIGGVSLFGNDDEDDDLFAAITKSGGTGNKEKGKVSTAPKSSASQGAGLFDDDDSDLFSVPTATDNKTSQPNQKTALFNDDAEDEEDDDDLFSEKASDKNNFESLDDKSSDTDPLKKLPPGAVSMFGGGANPLISEVKAKQKNSSKDDSDGSHKEPLNTSQNARISKESAKAKPTVGGGLLFGGDQSDDDDDLFSSMTAAKPSSSNKKGAEKKVDLFADDGDDDEDDMFASVTNKKARGQAATSPSKSGPSQINEEPGTTVTNKPSDKKLPPGAVPIFGGSDLFGSGPVKSNKNIDKKNENTRSRQPTTLSLFDGDDDEDDLFGTMPKKESTDSTRHPRTKSLFDDEDVLFGAAEENPTVDLFGASSPLSSPVKAVTHSTSKENSPTKSVSSSFEPSPSLDSSSPDNDLFSSMSSKASSGPVKVPAKTSSQATNSGLFGSSSPGSDLFSQSPKKPTKVPVEGVTTSESSSDVKLKSNNSSENPQIKKPAGAISMFGGMDPAAVLKKRGQSKNDSLFGSPTKEDDLFARTPKQTFGADLVKSPQTNLSSSPEDSKGQVGKLKSSLVINPAALLPGASRPVDEPVDTAVSFDSPASTNTLTSLQKNRAKMPSKRRPPTRRNKSSDENGTMSNGAVNGLDAGDRSINPSPASPTGNVIGSNKYNSGLFTSGISAGDDHKKEDTDISVSSETLLSRSPPKLGDQLPSRIEDQKQSVEKKSPDLFSRSPPDDLFSSMKSKSRDSSATLTSPIASKPPAVLDDDDDDIFAEAAVVRSKNTMRKKEVKMFDDDEDDLFSSYSTNIKVAAKAKPIEQDIFATTPPEIPDTIDDDEDIFAVKPKQRPKKIKAKTPDENLFHDNTDIFADIPTSQHKIKKTKAQSSKPLFKNVDDDIFADSVSTTKVKKNVKKKTVKKAAKLVEEDIFADPLNAFDN